jgi:hypothetical protein
VSAYTCPRCVNLIEYGIPHKCVVESDQAARPSKSTGPMTEADTGSPPCTFGLLPLGEDAA